MTDVKIITQFRSVAENEHLFRSGFNFSKDNHSAVDLLNFIEQHTDIQFEWINRSELVGGSFNETTGLRIIKKNYND
jgi:hypothetical protein